MSRLLNIDPKQNSAEKVMQLLGVPADMKLMANEINEIIDAINYLYNYGTGGASHPISASLQFVSLRGINTTTQEEDVYIAEGISRINITKNPNLLPFVYVLRKTLEGDVIIGFQQTLYLLLAREDIQAEHIVKLNTSQKLIKDIGIFAGGTIQYNINNSSPVTLRTNQVLKMQTDAVRYYLFTGNSGSYGTNMGQVDADDLHYVNNEPYQEPDLPLRSEVYIPFTFGDSQTIQIPPYKKKSVDVYINGVLLQEHQYNELHNTNEVEILTTLPGNEGITIKYTPENER